MSVDYEGIDEQLFDNNQLTNNEVSNIYSTLSVSMNEYIDVLDDLRFVQECIETIYDKNFKIIDSATLINNSLLLNQKFVELIKYCLKNNFKNVGYIFIGFTDYFDLDVQKTYKQLHEKIQIIIRRSAKSLCGEKTFEKIEQKNNEHPELNIPTLFNLARYKKE